MLILVLDSNFLRTILQKTIAENSNFILEDHNVSNRNFYISASFAFKNFCIMFNGKKILIFERKKVRIVHEHHVFNI